MKQVMAMLLLCVFLAAALCGCFPSSGQEHQEAPDETSRQSQETIPIQTIPNPPETDILHPSVPIDPIPENTDDSDFQLPPGEEPTISHEVK